MSSSYGEANMARNWGLTTFWVTLKKVEPWDDWNPSQQLKRDLQSEPLTNVGEPWAIYMTEVYTHRTMSLGAGPWIKRGGKIIETKFQGRRCNHTYMLSSPPSRHMQNYTSLSSEITHDHLTYSDQWNLSKSNTCHFQGKIVKNWYMMSPILCHTDWTLSKWCGLPLAMSLSRKQNSPLSTPNLWWT